MKLWNKGINVINVIKKHYYLTYTIGFLFITYGVFGVFLWMGKGFVWNVDGQTQHLVALMYYSDWLKQIIGSIIEEHRLIIPMWDLSIGNGSDILTTLHYYVIGDPLNLLSVFIKTENMEKLYSALILVRIYLVGLAFSLYCLEHKYKKSAVLIGSYMYCFSAYVQITAIRHPFFINAMVYFPLMLLGIDRVFKKKKPYLFIVSTAIAAASSFYFFYMLVIGCILYVLLSYKNQVGQWKAKEVMGWFLKISLLGMIALMLAAFIFLPNAMAALMSERMGQQREIPLLFNVKHYKALFVALLDQTGVGSYARPGVAVPAMLAMLLLFCKKGYKEWKTSIVLMLVVLSVPFLGSVMNGFSYVSYRCCFLAVFLMSLLFVKMFPSLISLTMQEKRKLLKISIGYITIALCLTTVKSEQLYIMIAMMLLCLCVLISSGTIVERKRGVEILVGMIAVGSIFISAYYNFWPEESDYILSFVDRDAAVERLNNEYDTDKENEYYNASDVMQVIHEEMGLERMEMYGCEDISHNTAMLHDINGVSFYFSLHNPYISRFHKEMGLMKKAECKYKDLDCRSFLEAVHNVKYFVTVSDDVYRYNSSLFLGEPIAEKNGVCLFEATDSLGFAYGYDSVYSREEYEKLNQVNRQEMLLKGAMLEDEEVIEQMPETDFEITATQKDYTVDFGEDISAQDNTIYVDKDGAEMTVYFEGDTNCETYVLLRGIEYSGEETWKKKLDKKMKGAANIYEKAKLIKAKENHNEKEKISIRIFNNVGKGGAEQIFYTKKANGYVGMDDYLWNMGYCETPMNYVTIRFGEAGEYNIESLGIYCQPVDQLPDLLKERKVEGADSFVAGVNEYTGHVKLTEKEIVCFSVPYSKGWKVYVNGEEKKALQANTMWLAVLLDKGEYNIELKYATPYFKEGVMVSIIALVVFIMIIGIDIKNHKQKKM